MKQELNMNFVLFIEILQININYGTPPYCKGDKDS